MLILALIVSVLVVGALLALSPRTPRRLRPSRRTMNASRLAHGLFADVAGAALPGADTSISEGASGIASSLDLVCVLACSELGTDLSSLGGSLSLVKKASDVSAQFGRGEGLEYSSLYFSSTKKSILFGKLATTTAAAITNVDITGVTGTSLATFTGTPFDDADIAISCEKDFTVGTAGGLIAYSLDGGRTWSGNFRMGTATTFAIPSTGVTLNLTAGTLNEGDIITCTTTSPKWGAQAITDAFTALKNYNAIPRLVVILGDIADQAHLEAVTDAILDYETSVNRFARVICSVRDRYTPAVYQGSHHHVAELAGETVSVAASGETFTRSAGSFITDGFQVGDKVTWSGFVNSGNNSTFVISSLSATVMTCSTATGLVDEATVSNTACVGQASVTVDDTTKTYTRSDGSYVTDGFKAGMTVVFSGFSNSANNGPKTLTAVAATVLTVAETCVDETAVSGTTAVGTETDAEWRSSIEVIPGATPSSMIVSHKTCLTGGRARKKSGVDGFFKRRPASWPISMRWMSKDVKTSAAKVEDQGLAGWTITTADGKYEDHDERVDGGLLDMRIACLRTFAEVGINGVYCALDVTLDNDDAPLSRLSNGGVADLIANIIQSETTRKLGSNVELKDDGTAQPFELERINESILATIKDQVLAPTLGGTDPGPRASSVTFQLEPGVNLSQVGAEQPTESDVVFLGKFEKFTNRVVVTKPAA